MKQTHRVAAHSTSVPSKSGKGGTIVVRRSIPPTVDELFSAWLDEESLAPWMHPGTALPSTATVGCTNGMSTPP